MSTFAIPGALVGCGFALLVLPRLRRVLANRILGFLASVRGKVERVSSRRLGTELRLIGVSLEEFVVWKLVGPLVSLGVLLMVGIVSSPLGLQIPVTWALPVIGFACGLGFVLPDLWVRSAAKRQRMSFLFSFSSFLDLANVLLAGGAGVETALVAASEAGDGVAYARIREALIRARSTRRSPWQELQRLGDSLGLEVVSEVGASIQLAGDHGARVRTSLAKRAETVRHRQSAEVEAAANAATERMGLPMVLLFLGFLVLIGYPAAEQMLQGL